MNLLLVLRAATLIMAMNHLMYRYTSAVRLCPVLKTFSDSFVGATENDLTERWTVCDKDGV